MLSRRSEDAGEGTVGISSLQDKYIGSWFLGKGLQTPEGNPIKAHHSAPAGNCIEEHHNVPASRELY